MRGHDIHYRRNTLAGYVGLSVPLQRHRPDYAYVGITGGFGGDRRVEYIIPLDARKSGTHSFVAEATCNGMFGVPWNGDSIQPPDVCLFTFFYGMWRRSPGRSPTDISNLLRLILLCPI